MHGQTQDRFFLRTLGVRRLHLSPGQGRLGDLQPVPACGYLQSHRRLEPQRDAVSRQSAHVVRGGDDARRFGEPREEVSAVHVVDHCVSAAGLGVFVGDSKGKVSWTTVLASVNCICDL